MNKFLLDSMIKISLAALASLSLAALAQDFPSKSVRIIVPWPPSGNVDITARTIAPAFSESLGQQVIVENRAGAGGTIGSDVVAKAAPDGYTLLLVDALHIISPLFNRNTLSAPTFPPSRNPAWPAST